MQKIVGAIKASPAWDAGHRVVSNNYYNHVSLLKTIEGAFGLP